MFGIVPISVLEHGNQIPISTDLISGISGSFPVRKILLMSGEPLRLSQRLITVTQDALRCAAAGTKKARILRRAVSQREENVMRFGKKMALWAFCAVPAAAGMLMAGAGAASAAPAPQPWHPTNHAPHCNPWQRESWDVNGSNTVNLTYNNSPFTYAVTLHQNGSCVSGTLTDTGLASGHQNLSVSGSINGNHITFSVNYGPGSIQGTRTFTGDINKWGGVSGNWHETGSEAGHGTWSLQHQAHGACHGHHGWVFNSHGCQVWGH
jgi:hypothetical protein